MDNEALARWRSGPRRGDGCSPPPCGSSIEARAEATPDAVLAHEDTGQGADLRRLPRRLPAGRGRAASPTTASRPGTSVSWELPTWNESLVLVGALCRLGARQNPLIPIYRHREVGFITAQSECLAARRAHRLPGLRLRGHGPRDRRRPARAAGAGGRPRPARRRPGRRCPPVEPPPTDAAQARRSAGSSTPRAPRPTRRAPPTPTSR